MNLNAVALIGRANHEDQGLSQFSPMASGICVHSDGVVATCCHALVNFAERWSPYGVPKGPNVEFVVPDAERTERPWCFFPGENAWHNRGGDAGVYSVLSWQGDRKQDIAVVELGGGSTDRPFPFVSIATQPPVVGEFVELAGYIQTPDALLDRAGNVLGWRMIHASAQIVASQPTGFWVDYPVTSGMSGSGVFNERGALVGIILESWPPALSQQRLGLNRSLGFVAHGAWIVPQYMILRRLAEERAGRGELPWCGHSSDPP